ncbi:hypothetical protein U1Q18_040634 [Sarracenia purpurea var. burkii]
MRAGILTRDNGYLIPKMGESQEPVTRHLSSRLVAPLSITIPRLVIVIEDNIIDINPDVLQPRASLSRRFVTTVPLRGLTMGERPWGASSSVKAMKNSKQARNRLGDFSSGSRDRTKRSSKNHFGVLANLDSEEHFPSLAGTKNVGEVMALDSERTPYHVFRDAADLRLHLLLMNRDQSLDRQSKKYVMSSVKELEAEEKLAKVVPFDSVRIASLEARIRSMKGLSPLRIKNFTKELQSSAGANLQRAEGVIFNASPMADADHVVNTGEKDGKYVSGDEAVKEGALLDESIASLTFYR